jgi:hypothetical protein
MTTYPTRTNWIAAPYLLENTQKKVAVVRIAQQWLTPVAAGGDEVEITGSVVAAQTRRHRT